MNKKIVFPTMVVLLLVMLATTAFPALAARERRIKGSYWAAETHEVVPPTLYVDGNGSGNATQLGRYAISFQAEVNLQTRSGPVSATLTAANGDQLFAEGWGQATPTGQPNRVSIVEEYTITGGTGRFAGATGNFTVERLLNQTTGISSGTLKGYLLR